MTETKSVKAPKNAPKQAPKETIDGEGLSQFRFILRELMAKHRVHTTELARRIGLPQPTLHRLLNGKTEDPKLSTLSELANYFDVGLDELLGKVAAPSALSGKTVRTHTIPTISWTDVLHLKKFLDQLPAAEWKEWVSVDIKTSPQAFALITKPSMEPRFVNGSLLIVDPEAALCDGDFVIVHYPGTNEATIREIVLDGPVKELCLISDSSICHTLEDDTTILGVVLQTRLSYKNVHPEIIRKQ